MLKILFLPLLSLLLISLGVPAFADEYYDCVDDCKQAVATCVKQVRHTTDNIKEVEDGIAACEKSKADCIQKCEDTENSANSPPPPPPPPQEQPPQEQPPKVQPPVDFDGGIKTYDGSGIKTYEFK